MCSTKCCSMFWCFLFLFFGLLVLGIGIWFPVDPFVRDTLIMEDPTKIDDTLPWRGFVGGLIAVGSLSVLVGIMGMVATGCRSTGTLIAFLVFGSLCVIGGIALGSLAAVEYAAAWFDYMGSSEGQDELAAIYINNLEQYYLDDGSTEPFEEGWNRYQGLLACCAVDDFTVEYSNFSTNTNSPVPYSCCVMNDFSTPVRPENVANLTGCHIEAGTPPPAEYRYLNPEGCRDQILFRYIFDKSMVLGFTWGAVVFQIIALIIAGCFKDDTKVTTWTV